jgi:hypothetical protein
LRANRRPCSNSRMCNLYSIDIGQQAIRDLAKAMRDVTGIPGLDWTHRYPRTANSLAAQPVKAAYPDGELCRML